VRFLPDEQGALVATRSDDGAEKTWRARFVLDASGRDTVLGRQFDVKQRNDAHNSTALYAHFRNVRRNEGRDEGNITIFWFDHGWFWFIPLADGRTSIGAVTWPYYLKTRRTPMAEFLMDTIALCPKLAERLQGAELASEPEATGNYSYTCSRTHDAFIDPVFSSGVMLAMNSAFAGADAVDACLSHPERTKAALRRFDRTMRIGPKKFSWFIYRVTNPTMRNLFMGPRNLFRMQEALLSVLAGDVFGKTRIGPRLLAFKALYYGISLANMRRTYNAWKKRKNNIRPADAAL